MQASAAERNRVGLDPERPVDQEAPQQGVRDGGLGFPAGAQIGIQHHHRHTAHSFRRHMRLLAPTGAGPSFTEPVAGQKLELSTDDRHGKIRTEVTCKRRGGHLGHSMTAPCRPASATASTHSR